jgi:phage gp46-like protein
MSIDLKINNTNGFWDLDIENGDLAKTDSLDTAIYMSVFCEKRAEKISDPMNRRGHFTNQFVPVSGYQVGSLLWLYTEQAKNTDSNLSLIQSSVRDGLKWLIDDKIISKINVSTTKKESSVNIDIELINQRQSNSKYYNLFVNL